jgi:hypothetical protein
MRVMEPHPDELATPPMLRARKPPSIAPNVPRSRYSVRLRSIGVKPIETIRHV